MTRDTYTISWLCSEYVSFGVTLLSSNTDYSVERHSHDIRLGSLAKS
jgi:hypothetical protein